MFLPLDEEGGLPKWAPEELEALRCLRDSGLPSVLFSFCPRAGVWPGAPGVERVATQHRAAFCRVRPRSPYPFERWNLFVGFSAPVLFSRRGGNERA